MKFSRQTVVITGSGGGIGKVIALAFAKEGADVIVADIDEKMTKKTIAEVKSLGWQALAIRVNVSESREVDLMIEKTLKRFGKINVLVNCAAVDIKGALVEEMKEEDWDRVININLKGTFNCCKAVIKTMKKQRSEKIINFSSCVARTGCFRDSHYAASKAAVTNFTKSLAAELSLFGINVNAVSPGSIRTKLTEPIFAQPGEEERIRSKIAQKRIGKPEDVVGPVLFLASSAADYKTGQDIAVDGGMGVGF